MAVRKRRKELDKFQYALVASGRRDMMRWRRSKKKGKLLLHEIHKELFELRPPTPRPPTPPGKPTGRGRYLQWVSHHTSEIERALDTMKEIEFYSGRFPYRKAQITRHRRTSSSTSRPSCTSSTSSSSGCCSFSVRRAPAHERPAPAGY